MPEWWTIQSGPARRAAKAKYEAEYPLDGQPPECGFEDEEMIDHVPYVMKDNWTFVCPLTQREFPFGRDKESRQQALQEQQQHTRAEIERRERLAGRPLSPRELRQGIEHLETRDLRTRIADANKPTEPAPEKDWAQERINYLEQHPGHDPQERARVKHRIGELKRLVIQHEVQREAAEKSAAQAAAIAADPKIQDALAHSATVFNDLRFYRHATQEDVELAQQREQLAKTDPAAYWSSYWPWKADWDARADAAAQTVTDNAVAEQNKAKEMRREAQEIEDRAKAEQEKVKERTKETTAGA